MTELVFVALGSNVGDRAAYLAGARAAIATLPSTRLLAASRVEETAPFGAGAQGPYLNQMLCIGTQLAPHALLRAVQRVESLLGRVRSRRWGARTVDIDIVRFGAVSLRSRELVLPHAGLRHRDFWQRELAELETMVAA